MKKIFFDFLLFSISIASFFSVYAQDYDKLIIGKWYNKTETKFDGGVLITSIYVQDFLPNGVISEDKQVLVKNGSLLTSCNIVTDWQWSVVGNNLYQKKIGVNVTPDFVKENGVLINNQERLNNACEIFKKVFSKSILKTSTFKILKLDDKTNVYESFGDSGKSEISTDYRTSFGLTNYRIK